MKTGRFKLVYLDQVQGIAEQSYHYKKTIIPKGICTGIGEQRGADFTIGYGEPFLSGYQHLDSF